MHMHRHTFIRATHFSHFILLSYRPRARARRSLSLVNMIFLNSYVLSRAAPFPLSLCYIPLFLLFRRISFCGLSSLAGADVWLCCSRHRATRFISFLLPRCSLPLSPGFSYYVSFPFCVNLIPILSFLFSLPFLSLESFFVSFYFTALLHLVVSVPPSPLSFSRQLFPLCLLARSSLYPLSASSLSLSQSSRYTPQLARRDGFSFPACRTCI